MDMEKYVITIKDLFWAWQKDNVIQRQKCKSEKNNDNADVRKLEV